MGELRLGGLAVVAAVVSGDAAAAVSASRHLDAVQLFALADGEAAAHRSTQALAIYDALAHDPNPDYRAEARFRKGMLLASLGRYRQAALSFRQLLDEKPQAARARIELARMLAQLGDEAAARRELRQARTSSLPPDAVVLVDKYLQALRSSKRFGGSGEISLAPDSNINRATQARTLDTVVAPLVLSRDARARSGIGARLSGQLFARVPLNDALAIVPRLSGLGSFYRQKRFDDVSGSALVGLEWQVGRDRLSPSAGMTWRWYGRDLYARTATGVLDWLHPIDGRTQLTASLSAARAHYLRNPLQDGAILDLTTSLDHAFTRRAGGTAAVSITRQTADDPGYATRAAGLTLLGWREIAGSTAYLSAGARRTVGDARLFLFPARRREWLLTVRTGMTFRKLAIAGFAPIVRAQWERNASTVGLYDYRRVSTEIGIVRAF